MPREAAKRLTLNNRLLPALVVVLIGLQLIAPYRVWVILLVGLGGAWLLSFVWAASLMLGLRLTREMRLGWVQVGDWMQERFTLANKSFLPGLWVEIVDHSTLPDYQASRVIGIGFRNSRQWFSDGVCNRRGVFLLGPMEMRTGDPFGLYTVTVSFPATTTLMVMPPVVPLPAIEVAPGGRAGDGRARANTFERTVITSGVREYLPGDSTRLIHWRTTARRDEIYVRLFDSTPSGDWWIFLDMDSRAQAGRGADSTEEHGVILAASLTDIGLRSGRAVGLVTASRGDDLTWLPPRPGDGQRWEILRALALAALGSRALADVLAQARPSFHQIASLVVITPSLDSQWIESLIPLLNRGAVATVLLLDPVSFGGAGDTLGMRTLLSELDIAHYSITRNLLDRPELRPAQRGWRVMPTGRAVRVGPQRESIWRALG